MEIVNIQLKGESANELRDSSHFNRIPNKHLHTKVAISRIDDNKDKSKSSKPKLDKVTQLRPNKHNLKNKTYGTTRKPTKTKIKWSATSRDLASPNVASRVYDKGDKQYSFLIDNTGHILIADKNGINHIGRVCGYYPLTEIEDTHLKNKVIEQLIPTQYKQAVYNGSRYRKYSKTIQPKKGSHRKLSKATKSYVYFDGSLYLVHVNKARYIQVYECDVANFQLKNYIYDMSYLDYTANPTEVILNFNKWLSGSSSNLLIGFNIVIYQFDHNALDNQSNEVYTDYKILSNKLGNTTKHITEDSTLDKYSVSNDYAREIHKNHISNKEMVGSLSFALPDYMLFSYHHEKVRNARTHNEDLFTNEFSAYIDTSELSYREQIKHSKVTWEENIIDNEGYRVVTRSRHTGKILRVWRKGLLFNEARELTEKINQRLLKESTAC